MKPIIFRIDIKTIFSRKVSTHYKIFLKNPIPLEQWITFDAKMFIKDNCGYKKSEYKSFTVKEVTDVKEYDKAITNDINRTQEVIDIMSNRVDNLKKHLSNASKV